jgi:hypothetical protein
MVHPTQNEIGYSINIPGGAGDKAVLGTLGGLNTSTDTSFALVFDVLFKDANYNAFFGGASGSSSFYLFRNKNAGVINLEMTDESANVRNYGWTDKMIIGNWYNVIVNGVSSGADHIDFYVNGVELTQVSNTDDAGFNPTIAIPFQFGDADATNRGGLVVTKPYFYSRNLTAGEITDLVARRIYPTDFVYGWNMKRPNIGLVHAI